MELLETKSILAKLMATENLVVEQRQVSTAYFDVKNRVLVIPILDANLSPELYDLFTGHEVGHALYTPLEGMKKAKDLKLNMSIVGVVEDSRIERKIKYKYPGLRNSFIKGYKELMDKDFFDLEGRDVDNLNLIDRINLHCKGGADQVIHFTPEERVLLDSVESTQTYDEVIDVAKQITEFMRLQKEEELEQLEKQKPIKGQGEEDDGDDNHSDDSNSDFADDDLVDEKRNPQKSSSSKDEKEQDGQEQKSKSEKGNDDEEGEDVGLNKDKEIQGRGVYDKEQVIQDSLKSFTDEAFKRNEKSLFKDDGHTYYYGNIPKVKLDEAIVDYKEMYTTLKSDPHYEYISSNKRFMKIRRETEKVVGYLAKEFEMRKNADQMKRASVAKTGDLNMNKIFSYQFSDDIFKKATVVPGGKSHGLVMFIDWSGSMFDHIKNTMKQLISLVMFCKRIGVPYEVYCFSADGLHPYQDRKNSKGGDIIVSPFQLFNIFSSRMTASEFMLAGTVMSNIAHRPQDAPYWLSMGSTPLNQSIIAAMEIIPQFRKKYKLQMVNAVFLTDGEGDGCHHVWKDSGSGHLSGSTGVGRNSQMNRFIIRDPETKHQEIVDNKAHMGETSAYIKLLKARTNCNVLGFYMLQSRDLGFLLGRIYSDKDYSFIESAKDKFRKDRSIVVEKAAFDEYYLMRSEGRRDVNEPEFNITSENPTTKGLANAFIKYTGGRIASRVVLNRFIGMIT